VINNIDYVKALKGLTVLCCEDEPEAREHLNLIFIQRVGRLYIAEDGEKGLALYRKYKPDLVISDIKMPKMTGLEMSREIRELNPKAQIILLTAFDYKNFFLDAIDIGVSQYVQKPIGERKLFNAINRCIDMVLAEKKLDYQMRYIQNLLDAQSNLLFVTDGQRVLMANKRMLDFAGFASVEELVRRSDELNERIYYEEYALNKESWIKTLYENRTQRRRRITLASPGGKSKHYAVNITMLPEFKGRFLVSLTDISHLKSELDAELVDLESVGNEEFFGTPPHIDRVTGALDGAGLYEKLRELKNTTKTDPIIILLYIIDLANINAQYGFPTGNQALKRIVEIIKEVLGDNYRIGRLMGGHFAVIPPSTNLDLIKMAALKIKQSIGDKKLNDLMSIACSVKIAKAKELENYDTFIAGLSDSLKSLQAEG